MEKPKQQMLVKPSKDEIVTLKNRLVELLDEYLDLEEQKKESNHSYGEQMGKLWDDIRAARLRIKEGE